MEHEITLRGSRDADTPIKTVNTYKAGQERKAYEETVQIAQAQGYARCELWIGDRPQHIALRRDDGGYDEFDVFPSEQLAKGTFQNDLSKVMDASAASNR
jgi:hypothetical protein